MTQLEVEAVISDMLARQRALEVAMRQGKGQQTTQVTQQNAPTRLYFVPSPTVVFSGTTSEVTEYTPAGVYRMVPPGAVAAVLEIYTRTGDDAIKIYLSSDTFGACVVGSEDLSTKDEVGVWCQATVPLNQARDFYYKVLGDPGTTNWKEFYCSLVGYWA